MEIGYKMEVGKNTVVDMAFHKWHDIPETRAREMKAHLFENDSSSEDDENNASVHSHHHHHDGSMFQHEESSKLNPWQQLKAYRFPTTINPEMDNIYLLYQCLVAMAFTYNAVCIPLRMSFPYQTDSTMPYWLVADYFADFIYLIDIIFFQSRKQYLLGGVIQTESAKTKTNYLKSSRFKLDVAAILPTDIVYIQMGMVPAFRLNRLIKVQSYFEFNDRFEQILKDAAVFRVVRTTTYLLYVIHLDACFYYYVSYLKEFKSTWGYMLEGNAYMRCYFWAFLTTITIGNVPDPETTGEYILQLINYFAGLFIFSIVIGQVRDSVHSATQEMEDYRSKKNACINYMQRNHISEGIQKKIRLWFEYTWNTQRILDENALLQQMPDKMHTDLAINVHMDVLSKVELFKECDRQLLYDLLLKLQPILYLPGDYVCKKGEVGREMYIITNGMVQVVGDSTSQVFASLYPGTAFGEISLLAIGGGNRRTANIYSPGYTTLFILYKNDLNEVVKNYPEAQGILRRKAKKMLKKDNGKTPRSAAPSSAQPKQNTKFLNTVFDIAHINIKGLKKAFAPKS